MLEIMRFSKIGIILQNLIRKITFFKRKKAYAGLSIRYFLKDA